MPSPSPTRTSCKGRYLDTTPDNFALTMNVCCYSFTAVAQRAVPLMKNGGSLLTLTYYGAERVIPHYNVMGVAKAALEASVRYLAADLGEQKIRVNAISAGPIKTLAVAGIGDFRYILKWNELNSPLKRNVTTEEVGDAGLYLLSDLGTGVTGEVIMSTPAITSSAWSRPRRQADRRAARQLRRRVERRPAAMAGNSFGTLFRFTSWGESHGPAIGCVVDGTPPRIPLAEADIQVWIDKRRPGQSRFVTQRQEPDTVKILSGVFEGVTTGTPIALHIDNVDQRSRDYGEIKDQFRPGHADYTYLKKYGVRDYRGGGRQSARETAVRVAAGAIARKVLGDAVTIRGAVVQIGSQKIDRAHWDWDATGDNPFWCPDRQAAQGWEGYLDDVRKRGSSCGAVIEVVASGVPVGPGRADLRQARCRSRRGADEHQCGQGRRDRRRLRDGRAERRGERRRDAHARTAPPTFLTNHAGGILGGISTGQDIVCRLAVKPTSSILSPVRSVDRFGNEVELRTKGRHDPCVGIRAVPVAEAMVACVLADHLLRHRAPVRLSATWRRRSPLEARYGRLHNLSMAVSPRP